MLRTSIPWATALLLALPALGVAQQTIALDVSDRTTLDWVGGSTAGPLLSNDTEADVRGRLRIQFASTPTGRVAEIAGTLRLEPTLGSVLDPTGTSIARAAFTDVTLGLSAAATPVTHIPGGGLRLDFDVHAGFQSGTVALDPPIGASSSTDLSGTPADRFRLVARLFNDGGTWRLAAPLRFELRFDNGAGFAGAFRFRGPLRAEEPCDPVRPFCSQGPGTPRLVALPRSSASGAPTLRFVAHTSAPGLNVVLFGGVRQPPSAIAAGDLCIGAPRRVLAMGTSDMAGHALLEWQPGPGGTVALNSGAFATQALVATQPATLTNALALELCH